MSAAHLNLIGTPFPSGRIAMISQSGNLVRAAAEEFETAGLGFSSFVTVGNQADLKIHDYLDYLKDDPETRVILIYVEGVAPGTGRSLP
jgi:acetate---CoA ligase (ADP-forming)